MSGHDSIRWNKRSSKSRNDSLMQHSIATGLMYRVVDLLAVVVAGLLSTFMYSIGPLRLGQDHVSAILASLLLVIVVFDRAGLYEPWRGRRIHEQVGYMSLAWTIVFALLIVAAFVLQFSAYYGRGWALTWFALGFLFLFVARAVTALILRRLRSLGFNHKRVVVVGAGTWGCSVVERIKTVDWIGFDFKCFLDPHPEQFESRLLEIPVQGHYERLPSIIAGGDVDEVWICLPAGSRDEQGNRHADRVIHLLRHSLVTKRVVPDLSEMRLLERPVIEIAGVPFLTISGTPHEGLNRLIKKAEDLLLGSASLLLAVPLMLAIALTIKLTSRGPVLFKQQRHGWDGRPFDLYKFRTMHVHVEQDGEVTQATRQDPRVTPFGAFLRSTSLDELPQFINVLLGQMSIVGPRPHALCHNELYKEQIDSYMQRHVVKPGITGWAQVNGWRGETDTVEKMRRRVELDLYYIEHWSLWFDLKIIFLTLVRGFWHRNAY